ncbi:MAG: glycosyltransferase [Verrucomicrobiae bacterium]|nr:glycosyltransferase [Verrucomicrobiae bacterium]MCP5538610.1 glycosyltransferase [Akkermansiaceae bacterium]MCP5550927.1 glycosyltransferase [Akkermansiaceae bacterium]
MESLPNILLQIVFWLSVLGLAHSYVLYPALIRYLARRKRNNREVYDSGDAPGDWPHVVGVMAVHNEEAVLEATLTSIFATAYPRDRFELLVAADNCSDRSVEILNRFKEKHPNLTVREFPGRNGKIRVINQILGEHRVRLAGKGDYALILCDANVRWAPRLVAELVQHFKNDKIGLVSPNILDGRREHHGIADEEDAYINRENAIKLHEGILWGRMMGAFGACFAMRGRLFEPVPEKFRSDDFTHTIRCFELGYDAIVEPGAIAHEDVSEDIWTEFGRKRRISIGNMQNLERFWRFLLPWRAGMATAFAFWSHKGLRWFGPFLLLGAFGASAFLALSSWFYLLAFLGQIAGVVGASLDSWLAGSGTHLRPLRFARYFMLMNLALGIGIWRFFTEDQAGFWEPPKRVAAGTENAALPREAA